MNRRELLAGMAGAGMLPALTAKAQQQPENAAIALPGARNGSARITAVELWRLEGHREEAVGATGQRQTTPMNVYDQTMPELFHESAAPTRRMNPINHVYIKIKTDRAGLEGFYGPIAEESAIIIHRQLRPLLIGKDALAVEMLWDQMHRSNRHSRRGNYMMAMSVTDNALWDLRGKYYNAPVYRLLGGPTRASVETYASCLGYSVEAEPLKKRAVALRDEGYRYMKWFMPYGSGDGPRGMDHNVEMVKNLREAVGEDVQIMIDAFSGWDYNYAFEWAKKVEKYRPHWIEEPVISDKIDSFVRLRQSISFPVATGEHLYSRWEVLQFLKAGAIDVVQTDPEWCGGVTELVKICALASAHDVQVIPHGDKLHAALHVVASQSPMTCPLVEYLVLNLPRFHHFETSPLAPVNGRITLPEAPGFGIEIDAAKVEKQTQLTWD